MTKEEVIKASWELIEHRVRYYIFDSPIISDYEYDMLEKQTIAEAERLGMEKPVVADMVGINLDLPCVENAIHKLRGGDYV